ncbi:MAG: WYL domain-containing protein [Planctomycetota bacterium]
MATSRVQRLIRLITFLQDGPPRSVAELEEQMGVGRRTVFRDIRMLEAAGVPVDRQRGKGYRVRRDSFLPPFRLSVAETLGLMLLAKTAEADRGRPLTPAALSAIQKLIANVPEDLRRACSEMMAGVSVTPNRPAGATEETRFYTTLQEAIDRQLACDVVYRAPVESAPLRCRLRPYAVHLAKDAWYVLGKTDAADHGNEVRVFKLMRFEDVELTDRPFRRPARFKVSDKLGKAWRLNPEGREYDVELMFQPKVATNVAEVRWHPTQSVRPTADGGVRVSFTVDGLHEIAWWVCGYADQVRVKKPAALRRLVREMHERAAERNE